MAHGRCYPTVTLLSDGRVMTFSGWDETGATPPLGLHSSVPPILNRYTETTEGLGAAYNWPFWCGRSRLHR
jgi:hypothetical protein